MVCEGRRGADQCLGRRWQRMLDEYEIRFLALDAEQDRSLVGFFRAHPGWVLDYEGSDGVLFVRAEARPAEPGPVAVT